MINLIRKYKKEIFKYLFVINSFSQSWNNFWKIQILNIFQGKNISEEFLIKLGENLREIFLSTSSGSRIKVKFLLLVLDGKLY